ncbi:MAG: response regulator, partial [Paenisporosarcina sp.]|nr:response regulator [Paenisporosarcina sp.]
MKKSYQEMLIKRIQDTILQWENQQQITQDEMYRFFHGIKGTAGSIGLSTWSLVADKQLDHFHQHSQDAVSQSLKASALQSISNLLMEDEQIVTKSQMSATLDKNYVILIIDDDIIFVSNLKEILENEGITVFVAPTAKKGLELFFTLQPNFVLIDLHLHNEDGFNILKQISSQAMHQFIPIAVVTSHASKENLALAYELGTTDFIGKPLDFEKFIPYVKNRIQFKEKILHSISTDELTGAFNRKQ